MYIAIVLLLMVILPVSSVVIERYFIDGSAPILLLAGRWFVFWGVGIRLVSAGARQVINPRFTAETILGLKTSESWLVVRELGFANIAIGTVAFGSIFVPAWLPASAVAAAIFFGFRGNQPLCAN